MNRAALTRLRQRIDVLRCPVCRAVGRYVPEQQKPVGDDPFEHATEEERAEVSAILAAMNARQGNVPTECRGCGRPAAAAVEAGSEAVGEERGPTGRGCEGSDSGAEPRVGRGHQLGTHTEFCCETKRLEAVSRTS